MSDVFVADTERRFAGVQRLYGGDALLRFRAAHVVVAGIGGVGSWAVEALARNAIGQLTLIDLDNVAESNFNRQIHAVDDNIGKSKIRAMRERIQAINPDCIVHEIEDFLSVDTIAQLLPAGVDAVIDAIDDVRAKAALIAYCRQQRIALITTGGAGGKLDPTQVQTDDLARTHGDPLTAKLRTLLRKQYGFPAAAGTSQKPAGTSPVRTTKAARRFGITCVYSPENLRYPPNPDGSDGASCEAPQGLSCAGYGSSVCVTASFGFQAAAWVLARLAK